ncbi:nucleoside 2-deoxyribosyltransferase domain-containing protein [Cereibacter sphaeroides]|uniref:nucleoside 2-deoxyribosyltransferase domain-containing protein n=1 Tax=Cereibacter sphaeroides TaxID=1063 RepID=UPI001F413AC8|nr:nucleoside 2-deoxyribosyltransferase domain-containing protein [Cereibacter sphaeroides]MCE6957896.1 nucleoside 2-deoxyribosyltransferase domain-containing protein [Cereibacter sphaeroides]MCE6971756.1 nucleoside 2-deoxyribosyltransferase domain-containing protein [Cereibacter sphaeroides]
MGLNIVYAGEDLPAEILSTLFLAGPTPRAFPGDPAVRSWRADAIAWLERAGYHGAVLVPEPRSGWSSDYDGQIGWECAMRERADLILFWVPRDLEALPAFTTNIEFGEDLWRGRILYGRPSNAPKNRYLDARYREATGDEPCAALEDLLRAAVAIVGEGAARTSGERDVPLHIWRTRAFQGWYRTLVRAGNRLERFRVLRTIQVGGGSARAEPFGWMAHVHIHVSSEDRVKTNEVVVTRPDVASIVPVLDGPDGPEIVLTCEFRAQVRNLTGLVVEPPGGSSLDPHLDMRLVAVEELAEELGLAGVDPARLVEVGRRQVASTLLTHLATAYAFHPTAEEAARLRHLATSGTILGENPSDLTGERIRLRIVPLRSLYEERLDWSSMGLIHEALRVLQADGCTVATLQGEKELFHEA